MSKQNQDEEVVVMNPEDVVKELHDGKRSKGYIESFLVIQHDMTPKDAKNLVQNVLGKNTTGGADWESTIEFIRTNYESMDKADLIEGMMEKKNGKKSSMNHAFNYIKFAQEYARQEVEAFKNQDDNS